MNTKKIIILTAIFCSLFANSTYSQFFVEIGSGYAMPVKNIDRLADKNYYYGDSFAYRNTITHRETYEKKDFPRQNAMNGLFFSGEFGYKFKKNFVVSLNFQYLNNDKIKFLYEDNTYYDYYYNLYQISANNNTRKEFAEINSITTHKQSGRYFSFSPKISYIFTIKNFEIQPAIGFSFINTKTFLNTIREREEINYTLYHYNDNIMDTVVIGSSNTIQTYEEKIRQGAPILLSAYFALGFNFNITENISIKFLTEFNGLNITAFNGGKIERYYSKLSNNFETIYENNNIVDMAPGLSHKEQYGLGYTNVNFSIGVRYTFNKRQK